MRAVSVKRAALLRTYKTRRAVFLALDDGGVRCEFPLGCHAIADTVQHLRGRRGARLLDERYWAASCLRHNLWAEENTGEAYDLGWLIRVEGVAS